MRCEPFEQLAKVALERAGDERVKTVRTFAEAGFHKPCGLEVTAVDGYTLWVQVVRTSPHGGDTDGWERRPEAAAAEERRPNPLNPAGRPPQGRPAAPVLPVRALERLLKDAVGAAGHAEVEQVQTYAEAGLKTSKPEGVRVGFVDGSAIFAMFLGVAPPGATRPAHAEFAVPKEWI